MPPLKKSEKIMLGSIGVLIVVFIVMDPYYILYREKPVPEASSPAKPGATAKPAAKSAPKPAAGGKAADVVPQVAQVVRPKRDAVVFDTWGRDPFVQAKRSYDDAQAVSSLKLGGLSVRGDDTYALINSQIVRPGDFIEGMLVSRIESDRVVLSKGGHNFTLTWGQR